MKERKKKGRKIRRKKVRKSGEIKSLKCKKNVTQRKSMDMESKL